MACLSFQPAGSSPASVRFSSAASSLQGARAPTQHRRVQKWNLEAETAAAAAAAAAAAEQQREESNSSKDEGACTYGKAAV